MYSRVETITPEIAAKYLKHNGVNRSIRPAKVRNYARDMKNGKWQLSPQGISFYEDGELADGQHRLSGVILANVPVELYVTYDVPRSNTIQDRNMLRTPTDSLIMSGLSTKVANNRTVALTNFLFRMAGCDNPSIQTVNDFITDYANVLFDATNMTSKGIVKSKAKCNKASCYAAAFCAMICGVDPGVLERFFRSVNTGLYDGSRESSTVVLARYLEYDYNGNTTTERRNAFIVTLDAINDYVNGTPRTMKYDTKRPFPYWKHVKKTILARYLESYEMT